MQSETGGRTRALQVEGGEPTENGDDDHHEEEEKEKGRQVRGRGREEERERRMERDGEKGGAGGERAMHDMWGDEHGDEDQRRTGSERK